MKHSDTHSPSATKPLSLGVIFLTIFIDLVGFSIIFPLFPAILEHYAQDGLLRELTTQIESFGSSVGLNDSFTPVLFGGVLGSLYAVFQFVFSPIWGSLSDKYGRRPILLITTIGTGLSYVIWFFSGSFILLVAARLFGGATSGNLSVATAAVADVTTEKNRSKGMGLIGVAFGLGFVLGPALGGYFSSFNLLSANPEWARFGINPFSSVALVAAALSLTNIIWITLKFSESYSPQSNDVRAVNPFARLIATQTEPVRKTNFAYLIYIIAFSGMEFTLTFLGANRFDFGIPAITKMMIFIGFILILTQGGIVRRMAPKLGEKRTATTGLVFVAIGLAWISQAHTITQLYIGLTFMALGAGLCSPTLTALVSLYSGVNDQGKALGAFRAIGSLGRAVSPIFAGIIFWWLGSENLYLGGAVLVIIAAFFCSRLPAPQKKKQ